MTRLRAILIDPHRRAVQNVFANFTAHPQLTGQFIAQGKPGPLCFQSQIGIVLAVAEKVVVMVDRDGFAQEGQAYWKMKGVPRPVAGRGVVLAHDARVKVVDLPLFVQVDRFAEYVWWDIPESAARTKALAG